MPTLLILILALLVATCVIAYWSDNLGKKLGKKRISLLGLRPRQTATFISMGSSVGIMLLTLGVLLGSNASLRNALTRYDQTKKENSTLLATNKKLRSDSKTLEQQSNQWRRQADDARKEAADAGTKATQARRELSTARLELTRVRGELTGARSNAQQAQARAATAQRQFRSAQAGLRTAQLSLRTAQKELRSKENQLRSVRGQISNINAQLRSVQGQINQKQQELNASRRELGNSRRALKATQRALVSTQQTLIKDIERLQEELRALKDEQEALVAERTGLESEVGFRRGQIDELEEKIASIRQVKDDLSAGKIEIPALSVFAEQTVPAKASSEVARAAVRTLMEKGQDSLSKLGRDMELLRILPVGTSSAELTEEQLITLLVANLSASDVPVSVRLVAAVDHAPHENPVRVRFFTVPVETLFHKDDVITRTVIDQQIIESSNSDAQVFRQLLKLLNDGEAILRNQQGLRNQPGASPILTEEEPNFWPSGTNERIFEAMRRIQAVGGPAEVRLVAAKDLTTIGPMQIRFDVRSQGS